MRKTPRIFLGIDIGTTSVAAVAVDSKGKVLKCLTVPNPSAGELTEDGRDEQDADAILASVNALVAQCEAFVCAKGREVAGIGWTGQMHGLVAVNRKLQAITPFVTWRDRRCEPPALGSGIMADWRKRKVKGVYRALTIPGYVIARRIGRCLVDRTFRAAMGTDEQLKPFAKWLPEADDGLMLGDNQAGVYAALKLKPNAAVINLGTSGQLSRVVEEGEVRDGASRPFPGGRRLVCRASHVGGAALAKLRKSLGFSWQRLNDEAETNPRIVKCVAAVVDDLSPGVDMRGVRELVGIGNALRLNPCLKRAVERRFGLRCTVPEVDEMAAWGAALYAMDKSENKES